MDDYSVDDLGNPEFVKYARNLFPNGIRPDDEDFDRNANPKTESARARQYKLAQTRKLIRLYREWKAQQN